MDPTRDSTCSTACWTPAVENWRVETVEKVAIQRRLSDTAARMIGEREPLSGSKSPFPHRVAILFSEVEGDMDLSLKERILADLESALSVIRSRHERKKSVELIAQATACGLQSIVLEWIQQKTKNDPHQYGSLGLLTIDDLCSCQSSIAQMDSYRITEGNDELSAYITDLVLVLMRDEEPPEFIADPLTRCLAHKVNCFAIGGNNAIISTSLVPPGTDTSWVRTSHRLHRLTPAPDEAAKHLPSEKQGSVSSVVGTITELGSMLWRGTSPFS